MFRANGHQVYLGLLIRYCLLCCLVMVVKLYIFTRLNYPALGRLVLPADLLGLPEEENVLFDRELPRYSYYAPEEIASLLPTNSVILQTAGTEKEWNPERVAVVLDTSAAMKEYGREVFSELAGLPDCQKEFWIAGDFPPARASASLEWKTEREFSSACEGGDLSEAI